MIKEYLNVAIALLSIGLGVSISTLIIDRIRKKTKNHVAYKKFIIVIAIIGATIGALLDSIIGQYIDGIQKQLSNIHPYTPTIFAIFSVFLFKKLIENIN